MKRASMRKIREALRLHAHGMSTREMALSLCVGRTTLRGYLRRAKRSPVWPGRRRGSSPTVILRAAFSRAVLEMFKGSTSNRTGPKRVIGVCALAG